MESIAQKIERARLNLYATKGSLISPEVIVASQKLDEHIVAYYKEQGYRFREERQPCK